MLIVFEENIHIYLGGENAFSKIHVPKLLSPIHLPLPFSNKTSLLFPWWLTEANACRSNDIVTACANNWLDLMGSGRVGEPT